MSGFTNKHPTFNIKYANKEDETIEKPIEGLENESEGTVTAVTREYQAANRWRMR